MNYNLNYELIKLILLIIYLEINFIFYFNRYMSHRKFEHPRCGSLGFLPRKRFYHIVLIIIKNNNN